VPPGGAAASGPPERPGQVQQGDRIGVAERELGVGRHGSAVVDDDEMRVIGSRLGAGAEPGAEYMCERPGLFGTCSIGGGRVRYRGSLNDPNALALTTVFALPMAFAFFERKRSAP